MVGSVDALNEGLRINGAVEPLPEDFDATAVIIDPVPSAVVDIGILKEEAQINKGKEKREIVLGRNVHTTCLEVTEPEADDEVTGEALEREKKRRKNWPLRCNKAGQRG